MITDKLGAANQKSYDFRHDDDELLSPDSPPTSSHCTLVYDDCTSLDPRDRVHRLCRPLAQKSVPSVSDTQLTSPWSMRSYFSENSPMPSRSGTTHHSASIYSEPLDEGTLDPPEDPEAEDEEDESSTRDDHPSAPGEVAVTASASDATQRDAESELDASVVAKGNDKYVRMEERLEDDLLNTYCDKLHEAVNKEVDGLLAIQYILVEPELVKRLVTGKKRMCQVIYDEEREHYVVLVREAGLSPQTQIVVYDPLIPSVNKLRTTLNSSVCKQIAALFSHLYAADELMSVAVETGISRQTDGWSCGFRAVGHITHLVLGIDPVCYDYELDPIREFFSTIMNKEKPSRMCFENANFGRPSTSRRSSHLLKAQVTRKGKLVINGVVVDDDEEEEEEEKEEEEEDDKKEDEEKEEEEDSNEEEEQNDEKEEDVPKCEKKHRDDVHEHRHSRQSSGSERRARTQHRTDHHEGGEKVDAVDHSL